MVSEVGKPREEEILEALRAQPYPCNHLYYYVYNICP